MNIIDIIGPVMIGPSSSHTAGAVRLGLLAAGILGAPPVKAQIDLHGSFAHTYRGHGTDVALLAGLMGWLPDDGSFAHTYRGHGTDVALLAGLMGWLPDDARIPQARKYAAEAGLEYNFAKVNLGDLTHPNTARFTLTAKDGKSCEVIGSSIGGGQVKVSAIDGAEVELDGKLPALLVSHTDKPGVIALVSSTLASASVNIATMRVFRKNKGGLATMVLECDQKVQSAIVQLLAALPPLR